MHYFLGIDVGGTKTHALIADETGATIGLGKAGAGNHEGVGYAGLAEAMKLATDVALDRAEISPRQIAGAGFGLGGYDWPSELLPTLEAIGKIGLENAKVEVVNDAMIGLMAGASQGWGIAVVSGTGCNCWGRDRHHHIGHVTGMGGWMAEASGAGELVLEALGKVSRAWSKRGAETALAQGFMDLTGAQNVEALLEGITQETLHVNASAARMVFAVAAEGDAVAQGVIRWAGDALADLACGVIRQLNFEQERFEVVMVGSLFNGGARLIDPFQGGVLKLAPGATFVRLDAPPVVGGVLLGMEAAGLEQANTLREKLVQSTRSYLQRYNEEISGQEN